MSRAPRTSIPENELNDSFVFRHIGPSEKDVQIMLENLNLKSLAELIEQTVPKNILSAKKLDLAKGMSEVETLVKAKEFAQQNQVFKSFIGMGYYGTITPTVILRNILENPGWYTAYTPYQAEISQGRLEALLNFQTMIMDLTAMPIANSSLLDEGTAAAEAMHLCHSQSKKKSAQKILVSKDCHPQTIEVLSRRAAPLNIEVLIQDHEDFSFSDDVFAALIQYPTSTGLIHDYANLVQNAHDKQVLVIVAADLLALTLLTPPGEWGADVVVGSSQRFGVPMGFGGPHAAYMATRDEYKRSMPGRLVGVSIDRDQQPALRLALQTREQHIRREKATSNICTAQVLLAVMAAMYAVYHGPEGLKKIAKRVHHYASIFSEGIRRMGFFTQNSQSAHSHDTSKPEGIPAFFDTVTLQLDQNDLDRVLAAVEEMEFNVRVASQTEISLSFDETTTRGDVENLWKCFATVAPLSVTINFDDIAPLEISNLPSQLVRKTEILQQKVFNNHHSETEMLRYLQSLQNKDLSLTHSMIPLGSCTMKLNSTTEMIPVTWPEFGQLHPFAPAQQVQGSVSMIRELEKMLVEITGFDAVSVQPNAGSAGEYAGLLAIRDYHISNGDVHRKICLIPASAHGTNPASAALAGMKVVVVKCDSQGNVDLEDLRACANEHSDQLAALMITYPSTHGVFEESIREICEIVHAHGGQVYMDGANMNALVGLCRPGEFGPDVCHLNLHKTFCIPHGGGGPGVGPIGVRKHLAAFLPGHSLATVHGFRAGVSAVSSAPFGSASILPIPWAYISMMGESGLKRATEVAILNANYIAYKLADHYSILYKGRNGRVAHECIVDFREFKASAGIEVEDVAKRLMDYGFHAPTMSWPVPGTLMIEPTESESLAELDRFCEAMISIKKEIQDIIDGRADREINLLKLAPHTAATVVSDSWNRSYSREQAAFPLPWVKKNKFWPSVSRINNPHGDRNLVCSCLPLEDY